MIVTCSYADIGIITALNSTLSQLKTDIKIEKRIDQANREFYIGVLDGQKVVIVRSPMGKVNNAITTQLLISMFSIQKVISVSPAGSTNDEIKIGDIIVASRVYQHDFGTIKPYGFIWKKVPDGTGRNESGYNVLQSEMAGAAMDFAKKHFRDTRNTVHLEIIVSGDQFISDPAKKGWLNKKFKAAAVDMGAGAIAQVCFANQVPLCLIRVITDKAGVSARTEFNKSVEKYQSDLNIHHFLKGVIHGLKS